MAKDKIESIEDLEELATTSFHVLKRNGNRRGKLQLSLEVDSEVRDIRRADPTIV